ncbi:MAG: lipopolysaccharide biosynthesis protein [Roseiarcus sp.]
MSMKRRLIGNGVANSGSIFWSAVVQIVSVPVLVHAWGVNAYGVWLMITTIPTYFALSDLGFAAAATSDMTMAYARGERHQVVVTFQSILLLGAGISSAAIALALPLLFMSAQDSGASFWQVHKIALFLVVAYSAAALCSRIALAAHRSVGCYVVGTIVFDVMQSAEGLSVLVAAMLGGGFLSAAAALLVWRLINFLTMSIILQRLRPWLLIGFGAARPSELKRLLAPALAAMSVPLALSLNIQGMILVAGTLISPGAAAVLGPVRTASRVAVQLGGIINRSTMPEFATALAKADRVGLRRLAKVNLFAIGLVLVPGSLLFAAFGSKLVALWTAGQITPPSSFIWIMAVATFSNGIWVFSSNLLLSVNAHGRLSFVAATASLLAIGAAIPLAKVLGLDGIALTVAGAELTAVIFLLYDLRTGIGKRFPQFEWIVRPARP